MEKSLYLLFEKIIQKYDLIPDCIQIRSNISKDEIETSKSIIIVEHGYPLESDIAGRTLVVNYSNVDTNTVQLVVRSFIFENVPLPSDYHILNQKNDKNFYYLSFDSNEDYVISYIELCILYCIDNYKSGSSFGCCSLFEQCSDSKKCLHKNKLYSKGCSYRKNLEAENIFYGKNKTIL